MQLISPEKIFRGTGAWLKSLPYIKKVSNRPLILGRSLSTNNIRQQIYKDLLDENFSIHSSNLKFDCCYEDLERISNIILKNNCDSIIAVGGGKVLDAGKFLGDSLSIPVITIPLSASTCAGWTALSNIYSKDGQFIKDIELKSCPEILVLDHGFIKTAPKRTLASGIADALAKWYESSLTSSKVEDGLVQQAIQISRVLRDQLLINGESAYKNQSIQNVAWCNVVEGCSLTAGLIGGIIVNEECQTSEGDIYAAGDCTEYYNSFYNRIINLESVQNANDQARCAAVNMAGGAQNYESLPWFWSDQYDAKIQMVGLNQESSEIVVRGNPITPGKKSLAVFYLENSRILAADCVNRPKEFAAAKQLIQDRVILERSMLEDEAIDPLAFKSLSTRS